MAAKVASFRMTGGLNVDVLPHLVPDNQWTGVSNIGFRNGIATGVRGYTLYGGAMAVAVPEHLVAMSAGESFLLGLAPSLVFAAGDPIAAVVNKVIEQVQPGLAIHVAATPAAWAGVAPQQLGQWTGGLINGVPFFNHPGYTPVDLRAGAPFLEFAGWAAAFGAIKAQAVRAYREFYVALGQHVGGISFDPDVVNWSARAAPTTAPAVWVPAAGNAAGNALLVGGGDVVDAAALGDTLMIYKRRSIWSMRYIGGNYIFDFQKVLDGVGALSQNCIVAVGRQHVFLTEDDVLAWTGAGSPSSLLDGKGRKLITGVINETNYRNAFLLHLPRQHEVWACFPTLSTHVGTAIVFDLQTGHVGRRQLTLTAHGTFLRERTAVGPGPYGQTILASRNGATLGLVPVDSGTVALNGGSLPAAVARFGMDFGKPTRSKTVRWVRPWITSADATPVSVTVSMGGSMRPDEAPTFSPSVAYITGTNDKADVFAQGRFLHLNMTVTNGTAFTVAGFDIGYEEGGEE